MKPGACKLPPMVFAHKWEPPQQTPGQGTDRQPSHSTPTVLVSRCRAVYYWGLETGWCKHAPTNPSPASALSHRIIQAGLIGNLLEIIHRVPETWALTSWWWPSRWPICCLLGSFTVYLVKKGVIFSWPQKRVEKMSTVPGLAHRSGDRQDPGTGAPAEILLLFSVVIGGGGLGWGAEWG